MRIPAKGMKGHLIHTINDKYMFRVYAEDFTFVDYELLHSDLLITIDDEDATLYLDEFGNGLDHNPETLGIKE
jgi:hypothetical protein